MEETIEKIQAGKSLIRFGDGEFGIYMGKDIHYQKWSPALKNAFEKIKADFESQGEKCPYILAVPLKFMTANGLFLLKKKVYISCWSQERYFYKKNFRREDRTYGDAFLFAKENRDRYQVLWATKNSPRNVIFLHNNQKYAIAFADTYHKNVRFLQCTPRNAFEDVETTEDKIMAVIRQENWNRADFQIILSAGPAGKVLAYELSKRGYHCIDAGHCWDDPLEAE